MKNNMAFIWDAQLWMLPIKNLEGIVGIMHILNFFSMK